MGAKGGKQTGTSTYCKHNVSCLSACARMCWLCAAHAGCMGHC
jgi:hypothetical protein